MKATKRYSLLQMLLAALCGVLLTLGAVTAFLWFALGPESLTLLEAWGIVNARFVGEYDRADAIDSALDGMVKGLGDRWSYYVNEEQNAAQNQRRSNSYVGIGVTVDYSDERGLKILSVKKEGPAEEAGLKPGEIITAVDGTSLAGEARQGGAELIQGEEGTTVLLTLLSEEGESREAEVRRAAIQNESVSACELLEGNIGYVALSNFYSGSAQQLNDAVDSLVEQGATALVFDMRNNGGGYVHELTQMLDHLLPEGPIFSSWSREGKVEVTQSDESCVDLPMVTLVNANTYSAAEFFAAQLKESVGASIVGEPTSGKGFSQQSIGLMNGGALNISTGKYATGAGVSLVGTGLTLDAEIILEEEQGTALAYGRLSHEEDPQLQKALELLDR